MSNSGNREGVLMAHSDRHILWLACRRRHFKLKLKSSNKSGRQQKQHKNKLVHKNKKKVEKINKVKC